jgi:5-methylcytosine-specific restriction protein A
MRAVDEWIGKNDDTAIPDRVRDRVFAKAEKCCTICGRPLRAGEVWTCEHVIALINWRSTAEQPLGNRESNLGVTCCNCLSGKNAADVSEKSDVYKTRLKMVLPKTEKQKANNGFRKLPPGMKRNWRTGRIEAR